ncbi:MAG: hypothetical protein IIB35_01995 [Gemmatimonadetes bacterium]|nr:hypothetical protein [Gemmatimonadota bacterium]
MTKRSVNNAIRALALGAAVAVAFTACESTTEPTTRTAGTPLTVYQLVLGRWVQETAVGQAQYYQFADDGTAAVWTQSESATSQEDLVFDLIWEIKEEAPNDVVIQGFGVLTYDRQGDVLLDGNGDHYRRALLLSM